jgi:hypothetical protein
MQKFITPDYINIQHYGTSQIHTSKTALKNGKWWRVWLHTINRYVDHRECVFITLWNFLESLANYWELKLIGICKFFWRNPFSKIWSCQMFSVKFLWKFLLFVLMDLATKIIYILIRNLWTILDRKQVCGSSIKPFFISLPKLVGLIQTILHDIASQYNLTCYRQYLQIPNPFQIHIARFCHLMTVYFILVVRRNAPHFLTPN